MPIRNVKPGWTISDKDPGPGAEDRGSGVEFTPGQPVNETSILVGVENSATDRGSGPEFERLPTFNAHSGKRMVEEQEPLIASPGLQLDLKPEVLAQLQRIEGMLMGLVSLIDMTLPEKPIVIRKVEGNFVLRELKLDDD